MSMTADQVRGLMKRAAGDSQKAWADRHKISASFVSDVLLGRREPAGKILDALGLERVVSYRKKAVPK